MDSSILSVSICIGKSIKIQRVKDFHFAKLANKVEGGYIGLRCIVDWRHSQALSYKCIPTNYFSHFSTKTYVVGTQKNYLNETILLSTQNMLKVMGKKILTIFR